MCKVSGNAEAGGRVAVVETGWGGHAYHVCGVKRCQKVGVCRCAVKVLWEGKRGSRRQRCSV